MATYILNKSKEDSKSGQNYEVHNADFCPYLPIPSNRLELGVFTDCIDAVALAKEKYPELSKDIDGCFYCSAKCHIE